MSNHPTPPSCHNPGGAESSGCAQGSCETCQDEARLTDRLARIRHKILVLSGKGGVGKSTVAANLAWALAEAGHAVGLLDVDIHGPSIPGLLGLEGQRLESSGEGIVPIDLAALKVMSIGFMLPQPDDAVIWRGPMKYNVIRQFVRDVEWGDLDYLIVDSPPGTGDEPLAVAQVLGNPDGAVVVTTPQRIALADVRKCITFCRHLDLPVLGVLENMSGYACPKCGETTALFDTGGGERMAAEMTVPFLGAIPIDPRIVTSGDQGRSFLQAHADSPAAEAFRRATGPITNLAASRKTTDPASSPVDSSANGDRFRIAVPVAGGRLATHFGHCEKFELFDVAPAAKEILGIDSAEAPPHEPGKLPQWLEEKDVHLIIAGGMGQRAQQLFSQKGIQVVVGASAGEPAAVVRDWLDGSLQTGDNLCDH